MLASCRRAARDHPAHGACSASAAVGGPRQCPAGLKLSPPPDSLANTPDPASHAPTTSLGAHSLAQPRSALRSGQMSARRNIRAELGIAASRGAGGGAGGARSRAALAIPASRRHPPPLRQNSEHTL